MSRVLLPIGKGENQYGQPCPSRQEGEVLHFPYAYHHSRNHLLCQRLWTAGISDSNLRMSRDIGGGIPPSSNKVVNIWEVNINGKDENQHPWSSAQKNCCCKALHQERRNTSWGTSKIYTKLNMISKASIIADN